MNQTPKISTETLADMLVRHGIIQPESVNDPEGYDLGAMMIGMRKAANEISEYFSAARGNSPAQSDESHSPRR